MTKEIFKDSVVRMAGDERRQQICQVAMHLFSEKGFRGTTTKEIANAAGVSEAMVFKHFANKDELYAAILDNKACSQKFRRPFAEIEEEIERKDDFGVFYKMALNALNHHEQDENFMRLMLHSALEGHQLAQTFFEGFIVQVYDFLGTYIRQRQADGAFREVDPRVVIRSFTGMFVNHSLSNILWDKGQKLLKISNEEAAREFATILLDGIKK